MRGRETSTDRLDLRDPRPRHPRRHTARGLERRAELLRVYRELLIEEGVEGASLNRVSRSVGVPVSTILYYFNSKEEMTAELVQDLIDEYRSSHGSEALASIEDPYERLLTLLDFYFTPAFQTVVDNRAFYSSLTMSLYDLGLRKSVEGLYLQSIDQLSQVLRVCVDAGKIAPCDFVVKAKAIYALQEGYCNLSVWEPFGEESVKLGQVLRNEALRMLGLEDTGSEGSGILLP